MRVMKSPQISFDGTQFIFAFEGETVTATLGSESDIFDFSGFPDGRTDSSMVETILAHNPIISAERVDGILSVELLNFISEDATEAEKFPEWIEV